MRPIFALIFACIFIPTLGVADTRLIRECLEYYPGGKREAAKKPHLASQWVNAKRTRTCGVYIEKCLLITAPVNEAAIIKAIWEGKSE